MSDNLIDIKEYSHFINDVLDESGKIAMKYFRQVKDLTLKGDYSPVTEADKNIESYNNCICADSQKNISFTYRYQMTYLGRRLQL